MLEFSGSCFQAMFRQIWNVQANFKMFKQFLKLSPNRMVIRANALA